MSHRREPIIFGFFIIFLLFCEKTHQSGQIVDYVSLPYKDLKNVTCIYHDTKFTCDCGNVDENMILPRLSGHVFHVSVSNCKSLSVQSNTLADTEGLRSVTFKNVNNLILEEHALAFSRFASNTPLIIGFEKVIIDQIHSLAINGNIEEISFVGGSIATIRAFGFTTLKEHAVLLKFDSVFIDLIEAQAFKKFTVEQLEISNCVITSNLPSKSFYDIEVLQFLRIHNVTFKEVHSRAFSFKALSKLMMTDNHFERVEGEWIEAEVRESVLIKSNAFGNTSPIAFKGLHVHRDYAASERIELRFFNNSINMRSDILPLEFNKQFQLNINQLKYENSFPCQMLDKRQPKIAFFRTFSDSIFFQTRKDQSQSLSVTKVIDHDCQERSYLVFIIVGVVAILLIIIIIAAIVGYQIVKRKRKRKLDIVLPEPRTYKETQIVLQIENAGLLKTDL